MKKLDELPEKWKVRITKESTKALCSYGSLFWNKWDTLGNCNYVIFPGTLTNDMNKPNAVIVDKYPDHIEISFKQFKKWVLKENIEEYVEIY